MVFFFLLKSRSVGCYFKRFRKWFPPFFWSAVKLETRIHPWEKLCSKGNTNGIRWLVLCNTKGIQWLILCDTNGIWWLRCISINSRVGGGWNQWWTWISTNYFIVFFRRRYCATQMGCNGWYWVFLQLQWLMPWLMQWLRSSLRQLVREKNQKKTSAKTFYRSEPRW